MFDHEELHRFFSSTKIRGLSTGEKILRTIFVHQFSYGRGLTLAEIHGRCAHIGSKRQMELAIGDMLSKGYISIDLNGRKYDHSVEYEGFRKLNRIMSEYKESNDK